MKTDRQILITGALLGFAGVALGAFGAHALKALLTANGRVDTYELAVRYQFYHGLALLIVGAIMPRFNTSQLKISARLFLGGIVLFSGSLYVLALTSVTIVAFVTPVGGVLLLAGWAFFVAGLVKESK
ncbi:MAG: DUF423 domain-containing protein [Bacteroidota bacterium]